MPNDRRLAVILMLLMVLVSAIVPTLASPAGAGFITGTVYIDRNVNGQMDAGENGVSGAERRFCGVNLKSKTCAPTLTDPIPSAACRMTCM